MMKSYISRVLCPVAVAYFLTLPTKAAVFDSAELIQPPYHNELGFSMYGAAHDLVGSDADYLGDINSDGLIDFGVCASDTTISDGQGCYVLYGQSDPADYPVDLAELRVEGNTKGAHIEATELDGFAACARLVGKGDINGDGVGDFAILCGAIFGDNLDELHQQTTTYGVVGVFYGSSDPQNPPLSGQFQLRDFFSDTWNAENGFLIRGNYAWEPNESSSSYEHNARLDKYILDTHFSDIELISDINGDGFDEIMLGSRVHRFIIYGGSAIELDGDNAIFNLRLLGEEYGNDGSRGIIFTRPEGALYLSGGGSVDIIGDINNDGFDDIAFNFSFGNISSSEEVYEAYEGLDALYVIFGPFNNTPTINLDNLLESDFDDGRLGFKVLADNDISHVGRYIGKHIDGLGDINGDQIDDFMIQVDEESGTDQDFVIFGKDYASGDIFPSETIINHVGAKGTPEHIPGFIIQGNFTLGVGSKGDFDGDGTADMCIGDYYGGTVSLIYGRNGRDFPSNLTLFPGNSTHPWQDSYDVLTIAGSDRNSFVGNHCDLSGDLNQDGYSDLILTGDAARTDNENLVESIRGRVYVLYGKARPNVAPLAIINGPSEAVSGETITFTGSESLDLNGTLEGFTWESSLELTESTDPNSVTVTMPEVDVDTVFELSLTVTDNEGAKSESVTLTLTVKPKPLPPPPAPTPTPSPVPAPMAEESGGGGAFYILSVLILFRLLVGNHSHRQTVASKTFLSTN